MVAIPPTNNTPQGAAKLAQACSQTHKTGVIGTAAAAGGAIGAAVFYWCPPFIGLSAPVGAFLGGAAGSVIVNAECADAKTAYYGNDEFWAAQPKR